MSSPEQKWIPHDFSNLRVELRVNGTARIIVLDNRVGLLRQGIGRLRAASVSEAFYRQLSLDSINQAATLAIDLIFSITNYLSLEAAHAMQYSEDIGTIEIDVHARLIAQLQEKAILRE